MPEIIALAVDRIRDFRETVRDCGYSTDDFELSEITGKSFGDEIEADDRIVKVRRKKTGVTRYYEGRYGINWIREFESNLRGNVFGFSGLIYDSRKPFSRPYGQHW